MAVKRYQKGDCISYTIVKPWYRTAITGNGRIVGIYDGLVLIATDRLYIEIPLECID